MTTRSRGWFLVLAALTTMPAAAQVEVVPPNPTTADHIRLHIHGGLQPGPEVTRSGNHFRIDVEHCDIQCIPVGTDASLGTLPAGSYTYEIFFGVFPLLNGGFVVTQAGIPDAPTLSPTALAALCLILVGAGCVFLRR